MALHMETSLVTTNVSPSHVFRDFSGLEVQQLCASVESGVPLLPSVKVNNQFDVR